MFKALASCLAFYLLLPVEAAAAAKPTESCDAKTLHTGLHDFTFEGISRSYRLTLPPRTDSVAPIPLIMLFHGWGGNEDEFLQFDDVVAAASERGYALVAPRGLGSGVPDEHNNSWTFRGSATGLDNSGGPICDSEMTNDYSYASCAETKANTCSWTQCQQDDVAFTLALLDHLNTQLCIDTERVFAVGGSNGGMFAWELAQNPVSAGRLRAIAPIIGLPHRTYLDGPGREGELPVLLITGQQDVTVPPGAWGALGFTTTSNGSDRYYYASASAITSVWAQAHDCDVSAEISLVPTAWEAVDCRSFCASDSGLPKVLDCRADVGHDYEFDWAWPLVLQFFDDHGGRKLP